MMSHPVLPGGSRNNNVVAVTDSSALATSESDRQVNRVENFGMTELDSGGEDTLYPSDGIEQLANSEMPGGLYALMAVVKN
jgi:hypothetical protein